MYNSEGNLTEDKYLQGEDNKNALVHFYCRTVVYCALRNSKRLKISYDWRGMPVEFRLEPTGSSDNSLFRLTMAYDGSGRRISKTRWVKNSNSQEWEKELVTHYTGIGTEVREDFSKNQTKVVVNMPEGFGRYGVEDALKNDANVAAGEIPMMSFEWYVKNHLGSTMLVYGTQGDAIHYRADFSKPLAAYDYRAFGEMVELVQPRTGKVTENFTGKEHDEEIALNYFGARYLDPMLGLWISVDPKRQFSSPYLYAGNGYNPVNGVDPDGNAAIIQKNGNNINVTIPVIFSGVAATPPNIKNVTSWIAKNLSGKYGKYNVKTAVVKYDIKKHGITYNIVKLLDGPSSQCDGGRGSCAKPTNMFPNLAYIDLNSQNPEYTATHETAHLMGLDDKYYRDPDKCGGQVVPILMMLNQAIVMRRMTLERLNNEKMVSYCILFCLFDIVHERG